MLTDIKGFTSKTSAFSRAETQELLARHRELVLPVIEKFRGRLVKTIGDAFLVAFNSPTDAVICGVEIQDVLKAHNSDKPQEEKIEIRIAINAGEVSVDVDGDIYGDAVNITSRLESIAEAGEVFFTEAVYLSMNKKEVPSSEIGYRQFKGIPEKIKVFRVLRETPVGAQSPGETAAAAAPTFGTPQPAPYRAGFWRRLGSLLTDMVIILIIMNTLGLQSCGPRARWEVKDKAGAKDIILKKVTVDDGGSSPVLERVETKSAGWDTGLQNSGAKHAPLKMLFWALYCGIFLWRFGATPAMKIFKLKAVDFSSGGPLTADKAFLRAFFSLVSLFGLLGYVWAIWEKDKRTWHDIIAGSRIVSNRYP